MSSFNTILILFSKTTAVYGQDINLLLEKLEIQNQILVPVTILLVIFSSLSYLRLLKLQKAQVQNALHLRQQQIDKSLTDTINPEQASSCIEETSTEILEEDNYNQNLNDDQDHIKQRILTYLRNELHIVPVVDIALIYTENTITYVVRSNGQKSVSSESLDTLFSCLDKNCFYRANRQIIIAAAAISKVIKMGNCRLKVEINPESELQIFIGKNKSASFKMWLNS